MSKAETHVVFDPFMGKDAHISSRLVDRLRGKYANGPTLPNGEPEFGWREFPTVPIQKEAADRIEAQDAEITKLREELKTARSWQSIGTAPKDRKVLLFGKDGLSIHNWNHFHVYNQPRFTHWMPLPEPPTSISSTEPVETME